MIKDITKIVIKCSNEEELNKISLIFLSYGYCWKDRESIKPRSISVVNEVIYISLSPKDLETYHELKGYRICLLDSLSISKYNKQLISLETFIQNF